MNEIILRAIEAAYKQGWSDARFDHMEQRREPQHPIGDSRKHTSGLLLAIDPSDLLGLQS